jgi:hypothetical protein
VYKIKTIELLNTAYLPKQLPKDMAFRKSIAFVGRSNGKIIADERTL